MSVWSAEGYYLAFDTSTEVGSVAVSRGADVLAREFLVEQRAHAQNLIPTIAATLEEAGVERSELSGIVVGAGPGSFTGVRIAAATAKGLVHASGLPLWAFSSLAAAAVNADLGFPRGVTGVSDGLVFPMSVNRGGLAPRCVLFDARADRVYTATYRVGPEGIETLSPPRPGTISETLENTYDPETRFMGDAAVRHLAQIEAAGFQVDPLPAGLPSADALIRLFEFYKDTPPVESPARWEPEYLKASSAQKRG